MNEVDYVSFYVLILHYLSWALRLAEPVSNNVAQLIIYLLHKWAGTFNVHSIVTNPFVELKGEGHGYFGMVCTGQEAGHVYLEGN